MGRISLQNRNPKDETDHVDGEERKEHQRQFRLPQRQIILHHTSGSRAYMDLDSEHTQTCV